MVIGFWLALNAEAPNSSINLKEELLPYAKRLVKMNPEIPSWQHVLGHYAWRTGDYDLAVTSFTKAADLYAAWMKKERISLNDCEGYVKARCYLANALYQKGDFEGAMKVAMDLRVKKLDVTRPRSNGNAILMWRAYNLPARLYIARGAKGDFNKALKSLPKKKELAPFVSHKKFPTLAGVYMDALSVYLGCRKAIDAKDLKAAVSLHQEVFRKHIMALADISKGASQTGDYSHYMRAGSSLAIYDMELGGLIAMRGPKSTQVVAVGRFLAARDKQHVPTMMMPIIVLTPMENRLGAYYESVGDFQAALEAYREGNQYAPGNVQSQRGIERCQAQLDQEP
jgi:tetratricopeptide (TPR) repeat protein